MSIRLPPYIFIYLYINYLGWTDVFLFQKVRIINDEYSYSGRFDRDGKALATGDELDATIINPCVQLAAREETPAICGLCARGLEEE